MTSKRSYLRPQPSREKFTANQYERIRVAASVIMGRLSKNLSRHLGGHLSMIRDHPGSNFEFEELDECFIELIGFLENVEQYPQKAPDNYSTSTEDALVIMAKYYMERVSEEMQEYGLSVLVFHDL